MLKTYLPYLAPLLIAVIILRRAGQARTVKTGRMWVRPVILLLLVGGALWDSHQPPGPVAIAGFIVAVILGAGVGIYMASHQHLTVDPETGEVSSRTSTIGTFLVLGLFAIRFGAKLVFPELATGHAGATHAANGLLIFTVAVLIAQSISVWRRMRPLLAEHAARKAEALTGQTPMGAVGEPAAQPAVQPITRTAE